MTQPLVTQNDKPRILDTYPDRLGVSIPGTNPVWLLIEGPMTAITGCGWNEVAHQLNRELTRRKLDHLVRVDLDEAGKLIAVAPTPRAQDCNRVCKECGGGMKEGQIHRCSNRPPLLETLRAGHKGWDWCLKGRNAVGCRNDFSIEVLDFWPTYSVSLMYGTRVMAQSSPVRHDPNKAVEDCLQRWELLRAGMKVWEKKT